MHPGQAGLGSEPAPALQKILVPGLQFAFFCLFVFLLWLPPRWRDARSHVPHRLSPVTAPCNSPDRPVDPTSPSRPANPSRRGFAIIISVTLLSFIILLLLSLVLMTKVGTQASASALMDEQAKRNALFGVDMAVSQLEKFAGPDQRTTVRADFGDISLNRDMAGIRFPQSNPQTGSIAEPSQIVSQVQVPYSANLVPMGLPETFAPGTKMWTARARQRRSWRPDLREDARQGAADLAGQRQRTR